MTVSALSFKRKIGLTLVVTFLVVVLGATYQFYYLEERGEYERAIRVRYRLTHQKNPNDAQVKHLAALALDRYGPTEFYRNSEDYERLFEQNERENAQRKNPADRAT